MLIRFLRFWRGTIRFRVKGRYLERFLNLCARAHIPLWDGQRDDQSYEGCSLRSQEKQLRAIAEKVHLDWELCDGYGAPELSRRYKKRGGFLAGAALCILGFILSQQFIWRIEVQGNQEVPSSVIVATLEELGLRKGSLKSRLEVIELADDLTLRHGDISWAGINLRGTVAQVEIVERVLPPDFVDEEGSCNVIAEKAGHLVELEVYDGKRMVQFGDTVKQGQLIASGIVTDKHGRSLYRHARAKAVVEYRREESIRIPLTSKELAAAGSHRNSYRLCIGDESLPISFSDLPNGDSFSTKPGLVESGIFKGEGGEQWFYSVRNRRLLGTDLILQVQQYIPAEEVTLSYSPSQAKKLALLQLEQLQRKLENEGIILQDRNTDTYVQDGIFCMEVSFLCREDVAKEIPILRQERENAGIR